MPNLNDGLSAADAATCGAGYYLSDDQCQQCNPQNQGRYCPGDDNYYACPKTNTDYNQFGYTLVEGVEGSWAKSPINSSPNKCYGSMFFADEHGNQFLNEAPFNGTNYWRDTDFLWFKAGPGYYLAQYHYTSWQDWYDAIKICSNAPAHAHYTGPGTPDEPRAGGATDFNDCPWACDAGYGRVGDECKPLCGAGVTQLRAGDMTVPLWAARQTTPALVVGINGSVCYGNLTSGRGDGINIQYGTAVYHMN